MASPKGLIFLDSKSAILHEQLQPRIIVSDPTVGPKREPCELSFYDFDDVAFKVVCQEETKSIVKVNMSMKSANELLRDGSRDYLERLFPGMVTAPDSGFNVAIQFNCDQLRDPEQFLERICDLKRHVLGGPMEKAFTALTAGSSEGLPILKFDYRPSESIFVCPSTSKIVVIFLVDFIDPTDKAVARIFLQEFVEAQRTVRTAPPVSFSKEPPGELTGPGAPTFSSNADAAGFISFALEERHVKGDRMDVAVTLLTGFRNYLHYHIKCSKTYLHMRMRKRVAGWLQVLNRAVPEVETEKKTAGGKTFSRK